MSSLQQRLRHWQRFQKVIKKRIVAEAVHKQVKHVDTLQAARCRPQFPNCTKVAAKYCHNSKIIDLLWHFCLGLESACQHLMCCCRGLQAPGPESANSIQHAGVEIWSHGGGCLWLPAEHTSLLEMSRELGTDMFWQMWVTC